MTRSSEELLSAYLDGELTAAEQGHVEELLADSAEFRQLHEELRALRSSLELLPQYQLPADFASLVQQRIERTLLTAPIAAASEPAPPSEEAAVEKTAASPSVAPPRWTPQTGTLVRIALATAATIAICVYYHPAPREIARERVALGTRDAADQKRAPARELAAAQVEPEASLREIPPMPAAPRAPEQFKSLAANQSIPTAPPPADPADGEKKDATGKVAEARPPAVSALPQDRVADRTAEIANSPANERLAASDSLMVVHVDVASPAARARTVETLRSVLAKRADDTAKRADDALPSSDPKSNSLAPSLAMRGTDSASDFANRTELNKNVAQGQAGNVQPRPAADMLRQAPSNGILQSTQNEGQDFDVVELVADFSRFAALLNDLSMDQSLVAPLRIDWDQANDRDRKAFDAPTAPMPLKAAPLVTDKAAQPAPSTLSATGGAPGSARGGATPAGGGAGLGARGRGAPAASGGGGGGGVRGFGGLDARSGPAARGDGSVAGTPGIAPASGRVLPSFEPNMRPNLTPQQDESQIHALFVIRVVPAPAAEAPAMPPK